jgi:hypothetical protein
LDTTLDASYVERWHFTKPKGLQKIALQYREVVFVSLRAGKGETHDTFRVGVHDVETIRQTQVHARGNRFIACIGHNAFQTRFVAVKYYNMQFLVY